MGDLHTDWVRERATSLTSGDPDSPLTDDERAAVDRMVGDAGLVALGEATHGSGAIIQATERVLRFLIRERRADVVILEACFGATQALDRYLVQGEGEAEEAVVAVGGWNYANRETLRFMNWLRDHNRASQEPPAPSASSAAIASRSTVPRHNCWACCKRSSELALSRRRTPPRRQGFWRPSRPTGTWACSRN